MRKVLAWGVLALLLCGCGPVQTREAMDGGVWDGMTFRHAYIGCEITVPKDWYSKQQDADNLEFLQPLEEFLERDNVYYLFKATQYEQDGIGGYPMIQMVARGMDTLEQHVTTAQEYLEQAPGILQGSNAEVLSDDLIGGDIGGRDFHMLPLQITRPDGTVVYHSLFARVEEEYLLLVGLSYLDQQQYEEALTVLQTLTFQ
ncbi:MAG: hypothetical protein ACOYI4_00820 [Christensenellales bacterium]|jgi:hypothetical protein